MADAAYYRAYRQTPNGKAAQARAQQQRAVRNRDKLREIKRARGCDRCGAVPEDLSRLGFVPRPGVTLKTSVGVISRHGWSTTLAAIAQCDLLCTACQGRQRAAP